MTVNVRSTSLLLPVAVCAALSACAMVDSRRQPTLTTQARLQVAAAADASGNNDLAISMYTEAAANEPGNVELQLRCADALTRAGKIDEARQLLSARLRTNPRQPELMRALALVDLVAGQPTQAIERFDQLLAADPRDVRALVDKAVALDLQGRHAAAQAIYQQVLTTSPDNAAARNNLAVSLMLEGRTRQALETLAPMQDADGSPPRLKVNLGLLYAVTGDSEQSRRLLGDRLSDGDLAAWTRALSSAADDRTRP